MADDQGSSSSSPLSSSDGATASAGTFDKTSIADLIAKHGSASATAWLEFERYKIWRSSFTDNIPQSSFSPVQGYMCREPYIFAWGNPVVSDPSALESTAQAFVSWVASQDFCPIWCCVDREFEQVLGGPGSKFEWGTVNCIQEDIIDPGHVLEITSPDVGGQAGTSVAKDLRKNLRRAEKGHVVVSSVKDAWSEEDIFQVEQGITEWKKSRFGLQLASTALTPWVDAEHRRYWVARKDNKIVGLIILTPAGPDSYLIKNALSFPDAPKGTSEELIYIALRDLHADEPQATVTFGITASESMKPGNNLSGWKITSLSKTYNGVVHSAGLLKRGDFRNKFDSDHKPMYVCYPEDGFGLDGINALLNMLQK